MKRICFFFCLLATLGALPNMVWAASANPFTLTPLETRVLGQNTWLRGGPAALRVIVSNHKTGQPMPAHVAVWLVGPKTASHALFSGETSRLGTVDAAFMAPKIKPGAYTLRVEVELPLGDDTVTQPLTLAESVQVMLSSDKPLYQPGQTIHLRALAMDMATRQPLAGTPVTFEVEDARGNKVFKQRAMLSRFGVASADFVLADEVNMGSVYPSRRVCRTGQTEKKVRVERYVLPKFKVALTTDKPYYLPGETVQGTVEAHYFFGKPVAGATVTVAVNTIDIGVTKLGELTGKTDAHGRVHLPTTRCRIVRRSAVRAGQGRGRVRRHPQRHGRPDAGRHTIVPVVKEPILLVVVPEHRGSGSRRREPRLHRRRHARRRSRCKALRNVCCTPARRRCRRSTALTTDDLGLATYAFTPCRRDAVTLTVDGDRRRRAIQHGQCRSLDAAPRKG